MESPTVEVTYRAVSPLQFVENFLSALTNADKDGRIVVNRQGLCCIIHRQLPVI